MSYQSAYTHNPGSQHSFSQPPYSQKTPDPVQVLSEAFPNIDRTTVAAIVASTKGEIGPATNALLAISGSSTANLQPQPPLNYQNAQPQMTALGPPSPAFPPQTSFNLQQPCSHNGSNLHLPPPQYDNSLSSPAPDQMTTPNQHPQYLAPAVSPPSYAAAQPQSNWQTGNTHGSYSYQSSPHLYPATSAPAQHHSNQHSTSTLPDIAGLTLTNSNMKRDRRPAHWAACDGCGQDPIRGMRWKCTKCEDYDLCGSCKDSQIHREHRFDEVPAGVETFRDVYCDSCGSDGKAILGPRFICQTHKDEDYCKKCIELGQACKGPFTEVRQTSLGRQLEIEGCLPMPNEWKSSLGPESTKYNVEMATMGTGWLDYTTGLHFFDVPKKVRRTKAYDPVFTIEVKATKGHFVSDHKHAWVMKKSNGTKVFSYVMETDRKTNVLKHQEFTDASGKSTHPVWRREGRTDSLTFQNPSTGAQYRWQTNRPISTLNDERLDYQRHALFERRGHGEVIVADFAWWNGEDEPEDCLTIRDSHIDHAFVIASMNILMDHQWKIMNDEFARDPDNVRKTEAKARLTRLGCASYWLGSDYATASAPTGSSGSSANKWKTANAALKTANAALEFTNAVMGGGGGS